MARRARDYRAEYQARIARAAARAAAAGRPAPTAREAAGHRPGRRPPTSTPAGTVTPAPTIGRAGSIVGSIADHRMVELAVTWFDQDGRQHSTIVYGKGGIRAATLKALIRSEGGLHTVVAGYLGSRYTVAVAIGGVQVIYR